jgi:hypothetical protein
MAYPTYFLIVMLHSGAWNAAFEMETIPFDSRKLCEHAKMRTIETFKTAIKAKVIAYCVKVR